MCGDINNSGVNVLIIYVSRILFHFQNSSGQKSSSLELKTNNLILSLEYSLESEKELDSFILKNLGMLQPGFEENMSS